MSLENGNGILDYEDLESCLKNYEKDNKVFEKAMIMLNLYMNQSSWPHSFNEYEEDCSKLLGGSPYWIGRTGSQLIPHFDNEDNSKIDSNFKNDLSFFAKTTWWILDNAYYNRFEPFSLSSIAYSLRDKIVNLKISRRDNLSLELSLSKNELSRMISTLNDIMKEEDN